MRGKPSTSNGPAVDVEGLARAAMSPARDAILAVLSLDEGRALSSEEISIETQAGVAATRYHARVLELLGLIEVVGEELGPDFHVRFYRLRKPLAPKPSPGPA